MGSPNKPMATRMNSTNLYVTTAQIVLKSDPKNPSSWQDLYRLVPYLRNSLCCVVCSNLLVQPLSPTAGQCQHHLCKNCRGGRKKIKPACESCKDCTSNDYVENRTLRILMQLYKKMCLTLIGSPIFKCIRVQASQPALGAGFERGASNLIQLIDEGASFKDDYTSQGGLPKSTYSILPCVYTNCPSPVQTNAPVQPNISDPNRVKPASASTVSAEPPNRTKPFYSVVYPGNGNKITIKRKSKEGATPVGAASGNKPTGTSSCKSKGEKAVFKKPCSKPKKGCRCGNATATPGKLTCCGQRCPCYVENKACIDCKCRGCRNPHRPDGNKVMPYIPGLEGPSLSAPPVSVPELQLQPIQVFPQQTTANVPRSVLGPSVPVSGPDQLQPVKVEGLELDPQFFAAAEPLAHQFKAYKLLNSFDPIQTLMSGDLIPYALNDDEDDSEITVV